MPTSIFHDPRACPQCTEQRRAYIQQEQDQLRGRGLFLSASRRADLEASWDRVIGQRHADQLAAGRRLSDLLDRSGSRPRTRLAPAGLPPLDPYADRDPRNNYSYKPGWKFYGEGPAHYGIELEITCSSYPVMNHAAAMATPYGFLKRDSSVQGFELVTHPFGYPEFMTLFPWPMLGVLRSEGCSVRAETNGLHIHVARAGFKNHYHQLRWLKFIYRNQNQMERLGRRRSHYGTFEPSVRRSQLAHIKWAKAVERHREMGNELHRLWDDLDRNSAPAAVREKENQARELEIRYRQHEETIAVLRGRDRSRSHRYSAVNVRPETTYEMRFMAASLGELEVKAGIQLAAATVEYTRGLTAHDIAAGDALKWRQFRAWVKDDGSYPQLREADLHATATIRPAANYRMSRTTIRS